MPAGRYIGSVSDLISDNVILPDVPRIYSDEVTLPDVDFCYNRALKWFAYGLVTVAKKWTALSCKRLEQINNSKRI